MPMLRHAANGWIISVHGREVDMVKIVHGQHPTAGRARCSEPGWRPRCTSDRKCVRI